MRIIHTIVVCAVLFLVSFVIVSNLIPFTTLDTYREYQLPTLSGDDEHVRITPVSREVVLVSPPITVIYCDMFDYQRKRLCNQLTKTSHRMDSSERSSLLKHVVARNWKPQTQLSLAETPCMFLVPKFYMIPLKRAYPTVQFVASLETESVVVCVREGISVNTWSNVRRFERPLTFGYLKDTVGSEIWDTWMKEEALEQKEDNSLTNIQSRGFDTYEAMLQAWQHNNDLDGLYIYGGHPSPFLSGLSERFELHLVDLSPLFDPDDTVGAELRMTYPHWVKTSVNIFDCVRGREQHMLEYDEDEQCFDYHFNTDALVYRTYGFRQLLLATTDVKNNVVADVVRRLQNAAGSPRLPNVPKDKLAVCPYDLNVHDGAKKAYGTSRFLVNNKE